MKKLSSPYTPIVLIALMGVWLGLADAVARPSGVREYVSREHRIAISFPRSWTLTPPVRNEIWLAYGRVRNAAVGCFVRVSTVPGLGLSGPDEFFAQTDEKAFVKLGSMSTPDMRVHLYDFAYLGDRKARRIIYSGTDAGVKAGHLVHQTLDGNRIVTVTCSAEQTAFQLVYDTFDEVVASFRFLK
jgi:hypothetical protein